jgi:hypothetical protein
MKNPLKRRKYDTIIKKDVKVKVWDDDPENFDIMYLYGVLSKSHKFEYPFRVWDDGKTGKDFDFNSYYTLSYKNAELIEEPKEENGFIPLSYGYLMCKKCLAMVEATTHDLHRCEPKENTIPEVQEFCDKYGVWCAMDKDNGWFWYKEKPETCENNPFAGKWYGGESYATLPFQPAVDGDWKDTLHEPRGKE